MGLTFPELHSLCKTKRVLFLDLPPMIRKLFLEQTAIEYLIPRQEKHRKDLNVEISVTALPGWRYLNV